MKEQVYNPMFEMAEQTMKKCEEVFRTGLKMQDEARRKFFAEACSLEWQKAFSLMGCMMDGMMPKNREELMDLMARNTQVFTDLYTKAAQASQYPNATDFPSKWMEMAKRSMESARSSVEDVTELRNKAIDSWVDCVKTTMRTDNPRS